eukprot:scaffold1669_cov129-Cylindrotheca_fusiformis.AAC.67
MAMSIRSSLRIDSRFRPKQLRNVDAKSLYRHLSTSSIDRLPDLEYIQEHYSIQFTSNTDNGSKEYLLLPPGRSTQEANIDPTLKLASLYRHRNIIFAARTWQHQYALSEICLPLVDVALKEAGENGDQPQAIASLAGLSSWVNACLKNDQESRELEKLRLSDPVGFEAVEAIATGVPRKGHSVVGVGTYRDGEVGWTALAREFVERSHGEEVNLYEQRGAKLVEIENMADQSAAYLQTAGGAMARLFFL